MGPPPTEGQGAWSGNLKQTAQESSQEIIRACQERGFIGQVTRTQINQAVETCKQQLAQEEDCSSLSIPGINCNSSGNVASEEPQSPNEDRGSDNPDNPEDPNDPNDPNNTSVAGTCSGEQELLKQEFEANCKIQHKQAHFCCGGGGAGCLVGMDPGSSGADLASVRDREKAKANAEKEKAEIRRAQAEEIKKIAIQKTNENIANFEAELETIQIDLELLSLIKEKYSTIDENLEDLSLVALNLEESMSLFIKNVNAEHLMLIEKIDELIFISQPVFDGDMRNQKINFSKEISQIIHDIKVYEDGDVYRGENYSKLEEVSYEKIKILFIELDLALQECFVRLEQAVKSKIDRKTEIESSLGIEKQNLSKLSEER